MISSWRACRDRPPCNLAVCGEKTQLVSRVLTFDPHVPSKTTLWLDYRDDNSCPEATATVVSKYENIPSVPTEGFDRQLLILQADP